MSSQRKAAASSECRTVRVTDVAPGGLAPVMELTPTVKRGMPVLTTPSPQGDASAAAAVPFQGFIIFKEENEDSVAARNKWFREMRGWLMVVATVAASMSYQAGLNPPGGFWQSPDPKHNYLAGNPVLRDMSPLRYKTFYYFNATTFVTSLVIAVLLMSERFYRSEAKVVTLMIATFLDLASLVSAYIAGSTRFMSSCIYVIVITAVAFLCLIAMGEVLEKICEFILKTSPCMLSLAMRNWCPVPRNVVDNATRQAQGDLDRASQRKKAKASAAAGSKQRPACCPSCAAPPTDDV